MNESNQAPSDPVEASRRSEMEGSGIYYRRPDGVSIKLDAADLWAVALRADGTVHLRSFINNEIDATYRDMSKAEAAVALAAIIQGFEPPMRLICRDAPVR